MVTQYRSAPPIADYTDRDFALLWHCVSGHVSDEGWTREEQAAVLRQNRGLDRRSWRAENGFPFSDFVTRQEIEPYFSWNSGYTRGQLIRLYWRCGDELDDQEVLVLQQYFGDSRGGVRGERPDGVELARYGVGAGRPNISRAQCLDYFPDEDTAIVVFNPLITMNALGKFVNGVQNKMESKKRFEAVLAVYKAVFGQTANIRVLSKSILMDLMTQTRGKVDLSQMYFEALDQVRLDEQRAKVVSPRLIGGGILVGTRDTIIGNTMPGPGDQWQVVESVYDEPGEEEDNEEEEDEEFDEDEDEAQTRGG